MKILKKKAEKETKGAKVGTAKGALAALAALGAAFAQTGTAWAGGGSPVGTAEIRVPVLADAAGFTLYVFDKDEAGKSNCYDGCATAWPPLLTDASALEAPLSIVTRADGSRQVAYQGRPLYRFFKDTETGDFYGDGLGGVWHIVRR